MDASGDAFSSLGDSEFPFRAGSDSVVLSRKGFRLRFGVENGLERPIVLNFPVNGFSALSRITSGVKNGFVKCFRTMLAGSRSSFVTGSSEPSVKIVSFSRPNPLVAVEKCVTEIGISVVIPMPESIAVVSEL